MADGLIETEADIARGAAWLAAREPRFAAALEETGPLPLRRRPGGFAALLHAICAQQISVASASAHFGRLAEIGADRPDVLLSLSDETLRACGLSRQKTAYARALAAADIDYDALATLPEAEAIAVLTAVKGIGRWTAEVYLTFSVGRADILAAGDLALQEAARLIFDLDQRPSEGALREMALPWSPWRAVAARLLWAYYLVAKNRAGIWE